VNRSGIRHSPIGKLITRAAILALRGLRPRAFAQADSGATAVHFYEFYSGILYGISYFLAGDFPSTQFAITRFKSGYGRL
jgi:hypothetical protein